MVKRNFLVIIPTFNEAKSIQLLLPHLLSFPVDILIVDDDSPDGTASICRAIEVDSNELGRITVLERRGKRGMGSAYLEGYFKALEKHYEFIIQMDADGSHRLDDLPKMMAAIEGDNAVGVVIGSRWIEGGNVQNWSKRREFLSRTANAYTKKCLDSEINDLTAGYRIYRTSLLHKMNLRGIESQGYSFQIEMTREALKVGTKIIEVPIIFVERMHGVSKMNSKIIVEAMLKVTAWGLLRKSNLTRKSVK